MWTGLYSLFDNRLRQRVGIEVEFDFLLKVHEACAKTQAAFVNVMNDVTET